MPPNEKHYEVRGMKKKTMILALIIVIITSSINSGSAVLVWEEDFENLPLNDWFLESYDTGGLVYPFEPIDCDPFIDNGSIHLHTPSEAVSPNDFLVTAIHNSSVAYGSWSFDFFTPEGQDPQSVGGAMFIGNNYGCGNVNLTGIRYSQLRACFQSYVIYIGTGGWGRGNSITINMYNGGDYTFIGDSGSPNLNITGFHHLNITRDLTGLFTVYLDSEEIFQETNNEITTSEIFEFVSFYGQISFDNLTVCDSVGPCLPTPTTTTTTLPVTTTTTTSTTVGTTEDTTSTTTSESETTSIHLEVTLLIAMVSMFFIRKRRQKE